MLRTLVVASACAGLLALLMAGPVAAQVVVKKKIEHPRLHHALFELREARRELETAKHDFGGHRVKAIKAVNAAITQIELCLNAVGEGTTGLPYEVEIYRKYRTFPHIRHAIQEMREARLALEKAPAIFHGHKKEAIRAINVAINQLELAIAAAKRRGIP
jgi:hypothetical protein